MEQLLERLIVDYPDVQFVEGASFLWSPQTQQVFYPKTIRVSHIGCYSVLHELSHALLGHMTYKNDYELLCMEIAAWEHAKALAPTYNITIDDNHVQDCLDTYRDWLYRRSVCPSCTAKGIQRDHKMIYWCFNCHNVWRVGISRFCRPYRYSRIEDNKKSPATITATDDSFWKL